MKWMLYLCWCSVKVWDDARDVHIHLKQAPEPGDKKLLRPAACSGGPAEHHRVNTAALGLFTNNNNNNNSHNFNVASAPDSPAVSDATSSRAGR